MPVTRAPAAVPAAGILSTVGRTPLIRLERLFSPASIELYAKLESHNPGGSMKDRPALRMVREAMKRGQVDHRSVLVESSSGNLAIGLAQVCAALELRLIVVVDPKVTQANLKILRAYGADIDMVATPDEETGEYLAARRKRVAHLVATLPGAVNLNQYANPGNPAAHRDGTAAEILDALQDRLDWLVVSVSTCGTLKGARLALRERGLATRILAVDAAGSVIFGARGARLLPGHGAGILPEHMAEDLADEAALVTDAQCVAGCRALVAREAVLAGASSGGIVAALHRLHHRWPAGTRVAAILPDRGERYLDTVYDDAWCERHFGAVPQLARSVDAATEDSTEPELAR
jgi:N-(2-amino-2-carboxyethyl)-L-glutamate synthase